MRTDGRTDRHDEASSRFSELPSRLKTSQLMLYRGTVAVVRTVKAGVTLGHFSGVN